MKSEDLLKFCEKYPSIVDVYILIIIYSIYIAVIRSTKHVIIQMQVRETSNNIKRKTIT